MQPSSRRVVDIGDVPVLLEAPDPDRLASVTALLGSLPASSEPPRATVRYLREPPPLPGRDPDSTYADMRVWSDADGLFLQYATDVRAYVTEAEAVIGGGVEHLEHGFARLFHPAVTHLLAQHGRFVLHAAAIARPWGAVLVLGHTGTGKSTLGLAAVGAGWRLLGDDLAVVRQGRDGQEVAGIARRTALPSDLGAEVMTDGRPLPGDHRRRWELPAGRLERGWFPVSGVILPAHSRRRAGELHPCDPHRALDAALASFASLADPSRLRRFLPCAAALARLPCWELRLAADAPNRLTDAAAQLERVATGVRRRA